jgi:hypothetical protein
MFHRVTSYLLVSHLFTPVRAAGDQEDSSPRLTLIILLRSKSDAGLKMRRPRRNLEDIPERLGALNEKI